LLVADFIIKTVNNRSLYCNLQVTTDQYDVRELPLTKRTN